MSFILSTLLSHIIHWFLVLYCLFIMKKNCNSILQLIKKYRNILDIHWEVPANQLLQGHCLLPCFSPIFWLVPEIDVHFLSLPKLSEHIQVYGKSNQRTCGSTISGHLLLLVTSTPFSVENESAGRPWRFQSRTSPAFARNAENLKFGVDGISDFKTWKERNSPYNCHIQFICRISWV